MLISRNSGSRLRAILKSVGDPSSRGDTPNVCILLNDYPSLRN